MWKIFMLTLTLAFTSRGEVDKKAIKTTPLSVYHLGAGIGSYYALSDELNDNSEQYLNVSFKNRIFLKKQFALTLDANVFAPGTNFGGDVGVDYFPLTSKIKPFLGLGLGVHYMGAGSQTFGEGMGSSAVVRGGVLMEVSDRLMMSLSLPYHLMANGNRDQLVGVQISFMFSNGLANINKLNF